MTVNLVGTYDPLVELAVNWDEHDVGLADVSGTIVVSGTVFDVLLGRKMAQMPTGDERYGILEICRVNGLTLAEQQVLIASVENPVYENVVPLPEELLPLVGQSVQINGLPAGEFINRLIKARTDQEPDPDKPGFDRDVTPSYTAEALQSTLTVEQTDAVFTSLGGITLAALEQQQASL